MKGPILEHYQEKEQTLNGAAYSAMLKKQTETCSSPQKKRTVV